MAKRIGVICIFLGIACILGAIGCILYNRWEDKHAQKTAQTILADVQSQIHRAQPVQPLPDILETVPDEMAVIQVGEDDCIGILSIPALDLELPVLTNWSYQKLKKAPCHYYGTYYEKDFVIAAHNYQSHFGKLSKLQPGDLVIFTDVHGSEHCYEVVLLETLPKNATLDMITSGFSLSLYTCTTGGGSRVTVRCNTIRQ